MDVRCAVQWGISFLRGRSPPLFPLLLPIMKSLILRLSYQPLMGEVSCGSNKGKWSYLYARPALWGWNKRTSVCLDTFVGQSSWEKGELNCIAIAGCTLSWRGREILDTKGSLRLKWIGSGLSGSTALWRTQSCKTNWRKLRTSFDEPRLSWGSTNPTTREAKWRWNKCKRRFVPACGQNCQHSLFQW